jgi:hypothetical protein
MSLNRLARVSYIVGKRTIKLRTNKFRTASTRFIPYCVDLVNSHDFSTQHIEYYLDTIAKAEAITLAVQIATIVYNTKGKKNTKSLSIKVPTTPKNYFENKQSP